MDRELRGALVGDWGRGLRPGQLEDAIVAAGLAEHVLAERRRWGMGDLEAAALLNEVRVKAVRALDDGQPVNWAWPSLETVDVLSEKGAYAAVTRLPLRVAIQPSPPEWSVSARLQPLVRALARPSSGGSVFVDASGPGSWGYGLISWPLRVGFTGDPGTRDIRDALDGVLFHRELIDVVDAGPCDVLVVGEPMSGLLSHGIVSSGGVEFGRDVDPDTAPALVVVAGEEDIDGSDADRLATSILAQTRSGGVHLCACGPRGGAAWLNQFIEHLSHDEPVDRALAAADDWLFGVGFPLLSERTVETLRLSFIVGQIREWFWAQSDLEIELPESVRDRLPGFPTGTPTTSGQVADYLGAHADRFRYDSEAEEATAIAGMVRSAGGFPDQVMWGAGPPEAAPPEVAAPPVAPPQVEAPPEAAPPEPDSPMADPPEAAPPAPSPPEAAAPPEPGPPEAAAPPEPGPPEAAPVEPSPPEAAGPPEPGPPRTAPPEVGASPEAGGEDGDDRGPRRLGADVIVDGHSMKRAFVADVPNRVRVTIGRSATHEAREPIAEPDFKDKDEVDLPVWARVGEAIHHGSITLPADQSQNATKPFEFEVVPAVGEQMSIEVVIYQPGGHDVLQAALLIGGVAETVAAEAHAPKSISLVVVEVAALIGAPARLPKDSIVQSATGMLMNATGEPIPIPASVDKVQQWARGTVKTIEKGAIAEEALGTPIDRAIVTLAGRGAIQLANLSKLEPLRDSPRVQIVSLDQTAVFPADFFYSGPKPDADARLCNGWEQSLREGDCTEHGLKGPTNGSTVCPLQFWSMSKVIEHHGPVDGPSTPFSAIGFRSIESSSIGPLAPVVVGVSERVLEEDPDALEIVSAELGAVSEAGDWDTWKDLVGSTGPGLLIAMPHQEPQGEFGMPTLELGGQPESVFREEHVTNGATSPGPVMLLLGCDTAVGGDSTLASFASSFSGKGASHVISSLGEVIAVQAPQAAAAFMKELAKVLRNPNDSLGEALLRTRRALLADHKLLPLMLVSHGDSDWGVH